MIHGYAAEKPGGELRPFEYDPGPLGPDEVEIDVKSCGICHSDLSMLDNEWGMTSYPLVPGHEAVGTVNRVGDAVKSLQRGQTVGVGWHASSCQTCAQCMSGDQNLCPSGVGTIVGRHGGFADKVRCQASWAIPIPEGVDPLGAGPLFCGGITVFNPILQFGVMPTHRVGVIGIGGLGHMALKFLRAWGCDVTAFSSSEAKSTEAMGFGAHRVVNSRDDGALEQLAGSLDFIISTVNVPLKWDAYVNTLRPRGRLHIVGAVLEPLGLTAFPLLVGQRSVSGSPVGSPVSMASMLEFCARHTIAPQIETFPMANVNDAIQHLRDGKARYRIVLTR